MGDDLRIALHVLPPCGLSVESRRFWNDHAPFVEPWQPAERQSTKQILIPSPDHSSQLRVNIKNDSGSTGKLAQRHQNNPAKFDNSISPSRAHETSFLENLEALGAASANSYGGKKDTREPGTGRASAHHQCSQRS
ncbi:hypothetical protein ACFPMG_05155 [Azospirillum himalayense]|uniref:Uncharacterized protein n=1 Tax=Azospirillum himalayense TaxID=654847 RepID=A0ABW0FZZ9_9PROT